MKSIHEILSAVGVAIPEDKKAEFDKEWKENYRTKAEYDKAVEQRDANKKALDDVQAKLEGFKDVNVDELQSKIGTLTAQLDEEKKGRAADAAKVERDRSIDSFLSGKKFVNALTEKSIRAALAEELGKETAKGKSIDDLFKAITSDADGKPFDNILVNESNQNAAQFTTTANKQGNGGNTVTKADIMKVKDAAERQKLIAQHIDLFK